MHLEARDYAVQQATAMNVNGVTKQLANRLLEPFMWHKVLISSTEWENFFNLRCPQYTLNNDDVFKSRKEFKAFYKEATEVVENHLAMPLFAEDTDILAWLKCNRGQADVHMMFLAEAIYDAINESTPKELKEGEWHIPYGDNIERFSTIPINGDTDLEELERNIQENRLKISIARCARLSYQTLGDNPEINYEKDLELYEVLARSGHYSPFEHVCKVMTEDEYNSWVKGKMPVSAHSISVPTDGMKGWCRNFKGFIQERVYLDK